MKTSSVAVLDDQSSYFFNSMPDLTLDLDTSSPGTITRVFPGNDIVEAYYEYLIAKYAEHFANTMWNLYCEEENAFWAYEP